MAATTHSLPDNRHLLVPQSQRAGKAVAMLSESLLNHAITTTWLKANRYQVQRSFDLMDGVPYITCFDYPRIAHVLSKSMPAFGVSENVKVSQLLQQLGVVIGARQELREWHDQDARENPSKHYLHNNAKHEAFLKVMKEVRRILLEAFT